MPSYRRTSLFITELRPSATSSQAAGKFTRIVPVPFLVTEQTYENMLLELRSSDRTSMVLQPLTEYQNFGGF